MLYGLLHIKQGKAMGHNLITTINTRPLGHGLSHELGSLPPPSETLLPRPVGES